MKSKVILCFALVLSFDLLAGLSVAAPASATDWQGALRSAITNDGAFPPFGSAGMIHFTIPAKAGQVLESRSKTDLLPFLAKLRVEPPPWKAGIVDTWIFIVRNGLRGTPMTMTNSVVIPGGHSVLQQIIPVYCYTYRYPVRPTNAAPARPTTPGSKKLQ